MLVVNIGGVSLSMVVGARCHLSWGVGPLLMVWVTDGLRGGDVSAYLGIGHCSHCLTSLSIIVACLGITTWPLLLM